ncbi:hypothetical protein P4O66_003790 [Electrophorus voltai]|uniref:Uncharacterized protein n=1 Tax=Electrophorus voltai TaxID=2609070 RepID=A0AAD9E6G2_9TELE|nr:hypothetical protein P4O66_003790 [Electrophorus voltai]
MPGSLLCCQRDVLLENSYPGGHVATDVWGGGGAPRQGCARGGSRPACLGRGGFREKPRGRGAHGASAHGGVRDGGRIKEPYQGRQEETGRQTAPIQVLSSPPPSPGDTGHGDDVTLLLLSPAPLASGGCSRGFSYCRACKNGMRPALGCEGKALQYHPRTKLLSSARFAVHGENETQTEASDVLLMPYVLRELGSERRDGREGKISTRHDDGTKLRPQKGENSLPTQ